MADSRISAHRGQTVDLNIKFYHNGVLADPYAIRTIKIYKTSVVATNLVEEIPVAEPTATDYPSPVIKNSTGDFYLPYDVALDAEVPNVYYDVWHYFASDPCPTGGTTACDLDDYQTSLLTSCNRFWIYPDGWNTDNELHSVNFGFEPLIQNFYKPESKYLDVGLMPLPLYDFDYNLMMPLIPHLTATISIETRNCELLVSDGPMSIGIRQGTYRTNPFILRYLLDTSSFLKGTYRYRIKLTMPDGTTRVSPPYHLVIG